MLCWCAFVINNVQKRASSGGTASIRQCNTAPRLLLHNNVPTPLFNFVVDCCTASCGTLCTLWTCCWAHNIVCTIFSHNDNYRLTYKTRTSVARDSLSYGISIRCDRYFTLTIAEWLFSDAVVSMKKTSKCYFKQMFKITAKKCKFRMPEL